MNLVLGSWWSRAIYVAAELLLADHLADGPRDAATLAEITGSHPHSLHRLLRSLSGLGVFAEVETGVFAHSELSSLLRSDLPDSLRDEVLLQGDDWHWRACGALGHTVRTGEAALRAPFLPHLY
jgi:multifunctional cyclase/dehydratase/O-methyltransferase